MNTMRLEQTVLLELRKLSTPTVYNGWEQITHRDRTSGAFNLEPTVDYTPHLGPMVGYAVTVVCEPSNPANAAGAAQAWNEYRAYVASVPGPKVVVVQDLDKPRVVGAFWGEVNANVHKALGCAGTITDGGVRDLEEVTEVGFKMLAARLCVGHAYVTPIRWGCEVEVFGTRVAPGQLIHADRHGYLTIDAEEAPALLEAVLFMDRNERETKIAAATRTDGCDMTELLGRIGEANRQFAQASAARFGRQGERT